MRYKGDGARELIAKTESREAGREGRGEGKGDRQRRQAATTCKTPNERGRDGGGALTIDNGPHPAPLLTRSERRRSRKRANDPVARSRPICLPQLMHSLPSTRRRPSRRRLCEKKERGSGGGMEGRGGRRRRRRRRLVRWRTRRTADGVGWGGIQRWRREAPDARKTGGRRQGGRRVGDETEDDTPPPPPPSCCCCLCWPTLKCGSRCQQSVRRRTLGRQPNRCIQSREGANGTVPLSKFTLPPRRARISHSPQSLRRPSSDSTPRAFKGGAGRVSKNTGGKG